MSFLIFKGLIYSWFRVVNRLDLQGTQSCLGKQKSYRRQPFLIVGNHNASQDIIMHMAAWAHLNYFTFVFTTETGFGTKHPFETMVKHFLEMVPRHGTGESSVLRVVHRLRQGDIIELAPTGNFPSGKWANTGFVAEGYSGAARVAFTYWKQVGRKLVIQPACSLGANVAYPPQKRGKNSERILNHKIIIKFGPPFTLDFSANPDYHEFKAKSHEIDMRIARIWGQKHIIPNLSRITHQQETGKGYPRVYDLDSPDSKTSWKIDDIT
ncbi:MAG TPA: 1-acyl-sn-glycerol-3-phosphate acyltransferase [Candidatus Lokiarchaeia archaeon]|nr:1-acyl-sn-glycerol-3-phosphate acyltransferase [Candidatus Lokiarchaeia archaeon]